MSIIKRGTPSHKRVRARNNTHKQAQARLDETVPAFNQQVVNSLFVDAVEIDYYQSQDLIGKPCTCEKIEVRPEYHAMADGASETNVMPVIPTVDDDCGRGTSIHLQDDDLFGDSEAEKLYGVQSVDVSGDNSVDTMRFDDDIPEALYQDSQTEDGNVEYTETSMMGSNANCGICYKNGFQPGFRAYGKQRFVLTTLGIENIAGYTVRTSDTPNTFVRQGPIKEHTFVEFSVSVPKRFKSCLFSVRNNDRVISGEKLFVDQLPMNMERLRHYAGHEMRVVCKASEFTHVVLEFDLGLEKLRANLSPENQRLDYQTLDAIGAFTVILPPTIHEVRNGDIIVAKNRRIVLKVTDKERKITADKRQLEWVAQTRIIQPTEAVKSIAKGYKII